MATQTSQRFSLKGWNFKTWIARNKDNLKLIISGVAGIATTLLSGVAAPYGVALGGLATAGSKILLDTLDYWQSE